MACWCKDKKKLTKKEQDVLKKVREELSWKKQSEGNRQPKKKTWYFQKL